MSHFVVRSDGYDSNSDPTASDEITAKKRQTGADYAEKLNKEFFMNNIFNAYGAYYELIVLGQRLIKEFSHIVSLLPDEVSKPLSIVKLGCVTGAHVKHPAWTGHNIPSID